MVKNIVVCCDGTANEFAADKTNVLKLFMTLVRDTNRQVIFYHPGVGTMEAAGAITTFGRRLTKLLGKAIGYGLETDIRDAYIFIMNHFEAGDNLYLFGFSRGAYTARAVASLLKMYGLMRKGQESLIPYAIRMLSGACKQADEIMAKTGDKRLAGEPFRLAEEFRGAFSAFDCKPHFVGIWDTVKSVGWIENPLTLPFSSNNPDIAVGRHAIAIDERRAFYRTNLWRFGPTGPAAGSDIKQVWFPGVHCDVGGGYPEAVSGRSKYPLKWMIDEARNNGLIFDEAKVDEVLKGVGTHAAASSDAPIHESLTWHWYAPEFISKKHWNWALKKWERRMNLFRRRTIPPGSYVHHSAYALGEDYRKRLPPDAIPVN